MGIQLKLLGTKDINKSLHLLLSSVFVTGILLGLTATGAFGQEANAPTYKDGDWWRVKVEASGALSSQARSGFCQDAYSEYVVKIEQGKPQIYGLKDSNEITIDCPTIVNAVLGTLASGSETPEPLFEYLRFPLRVGQTWSSTYRTKIGRKLVNNSIDYKVISLEKVQTPKGEMEAFKLQAMGTFGGIRTYYYSPAVKAIVRRTLEGPNSTRSMVILDFKLVE